MSHKMQTLTSKMRALAIENLKSRREEIFQRTRKLIDMEESQQESVVSHQSHHELLEEVQKAEEMELEEPKAKGRHHRKKKHRNTHNDYKTKRYWRRMLQVSDWLVAVPQNLSQFYVGVRGDGCKCLMIMKYNSIEICDKSGALLHQFASSTKSYNGTILQIYFNEGEKTIILSDMIVWKANPMTGSEFQFRCAWLQSNLNLKALEQSTDFAVYFTSYYPCSVQNLKLVYESVTPFKKEGLIFIHKDSAYQHGLNPNVMIWKDENISQFFSQERQENKLVSRGVGYINKQGEVKSLENVTLFVLDRKQFDTNHKFAKFSYSAMELDTDAEGKIEVKLQQLMLTDTCRNHYGPVDSLGKLFYKCSIKHGSIKFQQLLAALSHKMMAE